MQKQIMRRVYYSYIISVITHPMMWRGVFLGASALLLAKWLHVASIIQTFLAIPVGGVPHYVYTSVVNAATGGELLTVLTLLLSGAVSVSVGYKLMSLLAPKMVVMSRV